jgi:hypothetical protein
VNQSLTRKPRKRGLVKMDSQEASYWFEGSGDDEESYNDITERDLRGCHL